VRTKDDGKDVGIADNLLLLLAEYFWLIANFEHVQLVKTIYDSNKNCPPLAVSSLLKAERKWKVKVLPWKVGRGCLSF